jgi:hypothetical protein
MALNQTIFSPLTNYSGSISSFTSEDLGALQIISSSLPIYRATDWEYKVLNTSFSTVDTIQTPVSNLTLTLQNSKKYIVEAYLGGSTIRSANGLRVGVSASLSAETHYVIENPTTTTAIGYSFSTTNLAGSGPGSSLTNYYLVYIKALVITAATGVPTWTPTISSEAAGGGATDVAIGPSIIYYRQY